MFGALLNATCFAALLVIDLVLRGMPPPLGRGYSYLLQASFLAGAAALAIVMAVRTRNLAVDAAHVDVTVHGDLAGGRVRIDVIDDGPGFAPELVGAPLGEARSTKANGSGLGLAVAQALAQASDGTLLHGNWAAPRARVPLALP